jgi:hypothetical protein
LDRYIFCHVAGGSLTHSLGYFSLNISFLHVGDVAGDFIWLAQPFPLFSEAPPDLVGSYFHSHRMENTLW